MKVKELIEILQEIDPESVVNCYKPTYDSIFCMPVENVEQKLSDSWDCDNNCAIYEVVIE